MHACSPQRLLVAVASLALVLGLGSVTALPANARAACADLRVNSYTTEPAAPVKGQPVVFAIVVANAGTCAAGSFVTQLQSVDTDPRYWQSRTTDRLAPGATTTLRMGLDFPGPGTYSPTVVIDLGGTVAETDETNNSQALPVTVSPPTVELVVTDVVVSPRRPVRGQPMTLTATVRNTGASTDHAFNVTWAPAWNVDHLTQRVDGLAGGAATTLTWTYTYRSYWDFDSFVAVDTSAEIPEVDETNNDYRFQVGVDPARPDLVVEGVRLTPSNPQPGQAVAVAFRVRNLGSVGARPFQLHWQPSPQAAVRTVAAGGLAAASRRTLTFSHTFPTADVYQGTATVDPLGSVTEIEEGNNAIVITVPVAPHRTNLKTSARVRAATVPAGQPVVVDVDVWNEGDTASGPFTLQWNPDSTAVLGSRDRSLSQDVASLGRGQRRTLTFAYTYWEAGSYQAAAVVDAAHRVVETTDKDNRWTVPVEIAPAEALARHS